MNHTFRLIIVLSILSIGINIAATGQTLRDSVQIHFRQSKTDVDTNYMHNADSLRHLRTTGLLNNRRLSHYVLTDVKVIGGASPEGSVRFNEWLSSRRAERIYDYLRSQMIVPDTLTSFTLLGRDWEGLRRMVVADSNVPARDEVLAVIDEILVKYNRGEKESDGNLAKLKAIDSGVPYLYLYRKMFPSLRESKVVMTFVADMPVFPVGLQIDGCPPVLLTQPVIMLHEPIPTPERNFYMALKTNMLSDLAALPQASIEFYLGKNLSIVGNWTYGWWDNDPSHRYWRAYGGDIALRWWFGRKAHEKPLTGHHVGIYGGVLTYDFEFGGKGWMGGLPGHWLWDRFMRYGGVEYGYSLPIARRLNIDFTLGLGYMGGKYIEYVPKGDCYEWQATKQKHWFGPTKAEISLTWLIGHGNYNKKANKKGAAE